MTIIWIIFFIVYVLPAIVLIFMIFMLMKGQNWHDVYAGGQLRVKSLVAPIRYLPLWLIGLIIIITPAANLIFLYLLLNYKQENK